MSAPRRSTRNISKRRNPEDDDGHENELSVPARSSSKASDKRQKQEPKLTGKEIKSTATKTTVIGKKEEDVEAATAAAAGSPPPPQPKKGNSKPKTEKADEVLQASEAKAALSSKARPKEVAKKGKQPEETEYPLLPAGLRIMKETSGRWLMKSEPDVFSLDDLYRNKREGWDGVRNYVARNLLASMVPGDQAFFYHSNTKVPGIVGIMTIVEGPSLDETQFDPKNKYYDPKASRASPRWVQVHVEPLRRLSKIIDLAELRSHSDGKLKDMMLFKQSRLSVSMVSKEEWDFIMSLENKE